MQKVGIIRGSFKPKLQIEGLATSDKDVDSNIEGVSRKKWDEASSRALVISKH